MNIGDRVKLTLEVFYQGTHPGGMPVFSEEAEGWPRFAVTGPYKTEPVGPKEEDYPIGTVIFYTETKPLYVRVSNEQWLYLVVHPLGPRERTWTHVSDYLSKNTPARVVKP